MDEAEIRIPVRISMAELERRWKAVRLAMKEKGIRFPSRSEQYGLPRRICEMVYRFACRAQLSFNRYFSP